MKRSVGKKKWKNFVFIESNIEDYESCSQICKGADFILHQAALGSVPRSIKDPISSNNTNINGFLNMIEIEIGERMNEDNTENALIFFVFLIFEGSIPSTCEPFFLNNCNLDQNED